jgi:hypothetical protein
MSVSDNLLQPVVTDTQSATRNYTINASHLSLRVTVTGARSETYTVAKLISFSQAKSCVS